MSLDPNLQFEVEGYFEEVWDAACFPSVCLGTLRVPAHKVEAVRQSGRRYGAEGRVDLTITEPLTIQRGHKESVIKASPKHPRKLFTQLQPVCGRIKWKHPHDPK